MAWEVAPHRVVDLGPGFGKAAAILREYLIKPIIIDAVEMEPSYVDDRLLALYNHIDIADATTLPASYFDQYDLVMMIDVIEHMEKQDGLDLLARIPGNIIVCTPENFFDNPPDLPPSENHRSLWTLDDFGDRVAVNNSTLGGILVRLSPLTKHGGLSELHDQWDAAAQLGWKRSSHAISPPQLPGDQEAERLRCILPGEPKTVLEFGCGNGRVTQFLSPLFEKIIAVDISEGMVQLLEERKLPNVEAYVWDGLDNTPWSTDIFEQRTSSGDVTVTFQFPNIDAIYSDSVFVHNTKDDVRRIFRRLRQLVSPGTPFAFQLPCYESGQREAGSWTDIAIWMPREIHTALTAGGWMVQNIVINPGHFEWSAIGPHHHELHLATA